MLLAAGREGPAPDWPLVAQTDRERVLWENEWARPQAVVWERNGQENEVALYVRALARAEQPGASVSSRRLVEQQQHALGVTLAGLLRNRWRIEGDTTTRGLTPTPPYVRTGEDCRSDRAQCGSAGFGGL